MYNNDFMFSKTKDRKTLVKKYIYIKEKKKKVKHNFIENRKLIVSF